MKSFIYWWQNLSKAMGEALFHPYSNNYPPSIGYQPFTDKPEKKAKFV